MTELDGWVAALPALGQHGAASGVIRSPEALTRQVQGFYTTFLGRNGALAELQPWVTTLISGAAQEQVMAGILGSPEYYARAGTLVAAGTPDVRYVTSLYQALLNRASRPTLMSAAGLLGYRRSAAQCG